MPEGVLHDGRVLVAGGQVDRTGHITASAEIYDPSTGRWKFTGPMHYPRRDAFAVVLKNGDVLVGGGRRSDYRPESLLSGPAASAEIYDP